MDLPILSVWSRAKGGANSPDCSYLPGLQETQSLRVSGAGTGPGRLEVPRVTSGQGQLEGSRIQMLQLLMTGPRQCLPHLLIHEDRSRMGATRQLTQPRSATSKVRASPDPSKIPRFRKSLHLEDVIKLPQWGQFLGMLSGLNEMMYVLYFTSIMSLTGSRCERGGTGRGGDC